MILRLYSIIYNTRIKNPQIVTCIYLFIHSFLTHLISFSPDVILGIEVACCDLGYRLFIY